MYQVLEDYKLIYEKEPLGKFQRKEQHEKAVKWLKREYRNMPDLLISIKFVKQNENIKFTKLFYNKVIFSRIYDENNGFDVECLLFLFEKDIVQAYEEYVSYEKSILEIENIVLDKFPNNSIVLEYRYKRQKWWFDFSIHEVPVGVLCGMNGATQEQIKEMKSDLENFRKLCFLLNKKEEKYISYVLSIYEAWDDYLKNINKYSGLKNYLDENKIEY
ncbi:MAG: hypothetical protein K0R54_4413 [Clostridiaceae bacterium]|jgi:hypothetical protein|nr:hypothetical protein [Clostridiaceae bacterium]